MKVGNVYWEAEVRGVGEAQEQGDDLRNSFDDVTGSFLGTAAAQEEATDATQDHTEATQESERWTERLNADTGLLSSSLTFLSSKFGIASAAATVYSGAVTVATGATTLLNSAITATYALLAGPAGLAAGLFATIAAAGLLGSELLGLTDVTPVVATETTSMSGAFADMAYLIGGPLVGVLGAAFLALTGDFEGAKNMFINTSTEWAKAAARWAARVQLGFAAFGQTVITGFRATVETMDFAWRAGLNGLLTFINTWTENVRDAIVGGLNQAVQEAVGPLNSLIAKANQLPRVDIQPIGADFQVGATEERQTGRFSTVRNESLDSRIARVRRQGRENVASVAAETRRQLEQFSPDTTGGDRRTRTGLGRRAALPGEGGAAQRGTRRRRRGMGPGRAADGPSSEGPQEQNITVEIGDQSLNIKDLSRGEQRRLAKLIGDELGGSTQNLTGSK